MYSPSTHNSLMASSISLFSRAIRLTSILACQPVLSSKLVLILRKRSSGPGPSVCQCRPLHGAAAPISVPTDAQLLYLPRSCPGCGAFTQTKDPSQPGFYTTNRKSIKTFIPSNEGAQKSHLDESRVYEQVLENANVSLISHSGLIVSEYDDEAEAPSSQHAGEASITPICNRCHNLIHHCSGAPIVHPTLQSLQAIISESPHKYNHIYHVLDAADFPLSLIPSLQRHLSLAPQRSINRRAKKEYYQYGRKAEMSYIITRSDLLAPKKEQVDRLMPYILQALRDALAGVAENVRLGNVRCVSSKRGWWTKQVKEDVWNRGGGGWMVGKVNVGKSNLFESIFPKGRKEELGIDLVRQPSHHSLQHKMAKDALAEPRVYVDIPQAGKSIAELSHEQEVQYLGDSLLPPAPKETMYPVLPLISSLPGTTASPIRVPFGGGRGELIDLPGLARGDLEQFVTDDHRLDLVMQHRVKAKQMTIKPGQSLLVGGLVRITPVTPGLTFLAYPFVPVQSHISSTERAEAIHTQKDPFGSSTIAKPNIGDRMNSAGIYSLKWDVTKRRAGPLTNKAAVGLSPESLPFAVLSTDILIEGCGWIEMVAQVRKKNIEIRAKPGDLFDATTYPRVQIFSPDGRHIGVRRPLSAWLFNGEKPGLSRRSARPRRSMKGVEKELNKARHART